jgi:hypothetical protein
VSSSLSPIFYLFLIPSGVLYQKVQDPLAEDGATEGGHPSFMKRQRPGPKHTPHIRHSHFRVADRVHRVVEPKELLRTLAASYGVSYETICRILLQLPQQCGQQDA